MGRASTQWINEQLRREGHGLAFRYDERRRRWILAPADDEDASGEQATAEPAPRSTADGGKGGQPAPEKPDMNALIRSGNFNR